MNATFDLENHLTDRHSGCPVVESPLSFPHTHLVSGCVNADVGAYPSVEAVFHPLETLADDGFAVLQLRGGDSPVVVEEADAVGSVDEGRAASGAAGGYAWAAFAALFGFVFAWEEPALG